MTEPTDGKMSKEHRSANFNRLRRRLERMVGKAIGDFNMIEQDDLVMVCVSGGKDSFTLLEILRTLQRRAPVRFEIVAMNLNQMQPGFPDRALEEYFSSIGVQHRIEKQDTYSIVKRLIPEDKTTCSLCSRLRRGIIYRVAGEIGATKIALGHHRDDIIETLFLNMFFAGKLTAMPPKLVTDDRAHVVIRPLAYCAEKDIARFARGMQFPIIACGLCGSQPDLQRQNIKEMIKAWDRQDPRRSENIFAAIQNINPSHLLDSTLFDFRSIKSAG